MALSNWLAFGRDVTIGTIAMETIRFRNFSLSREIQVMFKKRASVFLDPIKHVLRVFWTA